MKAYQISHHEINNKLDSKEKIIKIDLSFLEAPKPYGDNYENVSQNTQEWLDLRRNKVTGSRLPALLGFYVKSKYDSIWSIVRNGKSEESLTHIRNIAHGHHYEDEAVKCFEATAKCTVEKCVFFHHQQKKRYGSSPDGLEPLGILLEVKTRAEASRGPLTSINKFPQYFVQCQLQMICTNAEFCILQSYHQETTSSNFFLVKRNNTLMDIVTEIVECIYDNERMLE